DPEREIPIVFGRDQVLRPEETYRLLGNLQPGRAVIDPRVEVAQRGRVLLRERARLLGRVLADGEAAVVGRRSDRTSDDAEAERQGCREQPNAQESGPVSP